MRARLIVNPQSGADRAPELLPLVNARLRTIVRDLDITITTTVGDAERAAARAVEERVDAVYVAGGDGTLNAAMRGLTRAVDPGSTSSPVVGVIPFGTGNDFAKALGLGEEPEAALELLLDGLVVDVDVGMLNERPFVNTSAGGFVAHVSEAVTEQLKDVAGKLAYLIGGARALLGTEPFSMRLVVHEGESVDAPQSAIDVQMFAVCNSRFIGGGFLIAPHALVDDGLLEVVVVPRMPMLEFVGVLQRLGAGLSADHPAVLQFRASAFDLEFDHRTHVNADGELLEADRCEYRVRRAGARFFCGPNPHTAAQPQRFSL